MGHLLICEADHPSRLVARMGHAGLVRREQDPADRRANIVTLTAHGTGVAGIIAELEAAWDAELAQRATPTQFAAATAALLHLRHSTPAGDALAARYRH